MGRLFDLQILPAKLRSRLYSDGVSGTLPVIQQAACRFVLLGILLLLAFAPMRMARGDDAQMVFFSLLFPELMPEAEWPAWLYDWLGSAAGEAVAL